MSTMIEVSTAAKSYRVRHERWEAVRQRSKDADGKFVFGVTTTKVFCRPSCVSRPPKEENVCFFDTAKDAEAEGFRACKRCAPDALAPEEQRRNAIVQICRLIEELLARDGAITTQMLAKSARMSGVHFQRVFKEIVGVSPKDYATMARAKRVKTELAQTESVAEAVYKSGFHSLSRFYENAKNILGMKPVDYRKGAAGLSIAFQIEDCSLGKVLIGATAQGVCAIELGGSDEEVLMQLKKHFPKAAFVEMNSAQARWVRQVVESLESSKFAPELPLDIQGTAFQKLAWNALREIPKGETTTYSKLAKQIGKPNAARAVANACASNKLAIAIPCHRVVRESGELGGYRWGIERKKKMLQRETSQDDGQHL